MAERMTLERTDLLVQVALMKYKMDLTQSEIAQRLNVSTMQISRLLERARQEGIVRIEVNTGIATDADLESGLRDRYGLEDVVVTKNGNTIDPIDRLVRAAAMYIDLVVIPGSVIGIAGGRTVIRIVPYLKLPAIKQNGDFQVVQLTGGFLNTSVFNPFSVLSEFASRFGVKGYFLATPIYHPHRDQIADYSVGHLAEIKSLWERCTVCLGSVGAAGRDCIFYEEGAISDAQLEETERKGAVGNIFGRWYDAAGEYLECELNRSVVSIPPEILKTIPKRILVTGALNRIEGIRAIVKKRAFNILITTDEVAKALL